MRVYSFLCQPQGHKSAPAEMARVRHHRLSLGMDPLSGCRAVVEKGWIEPRAQKSDLPTPRKQRSISTQNRASRCFGTLPNMRKSSR